MPLAHRLEAYATGRVAAGILPADDGFQRNSHRLGAYATEGTPEKISRWGPVLSRTPLAAAGEVSVY